MPIRWWPSKWLIARRSVPNASVRPTERAVLSKRRTESDENSSSRLGRIVHVSARRTWTQACKPGPGERLALGKSGQASSKPFRQTQVFGPGHFQRCVLYFRTPGIVWRKQAQETTRVDEHVLNTTSRLSWNIADIARLHSSTRSR